MSITRLLASSAAVAFLSGAASADDWSGFYVGVNAGYQWSVDGDLSNTGTDTGAAGLGTVLAAGGIPASVSLDTDGFIGGGQIGYNWQTGMVVAGLEADIQWLDYDDNDTFINPGGVFVPFEVESAKSIEWLGTVRGRLGAALFDRGLLYATGGLAYGETEVSNSFVCPTCLPPADISSSDSGIAFGWTAGLGGAFALTERLSLKAEALYYDLGDRSTTITFDYGANTSTLTSDTDFTGVIARGGINWRF